ncbi:hypothetical protein KFK09_009259 [Dendrobium nobile]|uniref:Uncharacterized protein n=1 Tax=Dendrobium nobile TaxID=94219 RepID=A0A8T3BRU7_DENNO|nr:hypothetical protein KFK09_009259 [Dendrobium nobile]
MAQPHWASAPFPSILPLLTRFKTRMDCRWITDRMGVGCLWGGEKANDRSMLRCFTRSLPEAFKFQAREREKQIVCKMDSLGLPYPM